MDKVCLELVENVNFTKQANLYLFFGKCIEAVSYHKRWLLKKLWKKEAIKACVSFN